MEEEKKGNTATAVTATAADDADEQRFRVFFRATMDRDYDFATSYSEVPDMVLTSARPRFPKDMLRFINTSLTSASFFIFREGIQPTYDDPANKDGGEYSVYFIITDMDESIEQMLIAMLNGTMLRPGLDANDINGIAIIPKQNNNVTVKIWVHNRSAFKGLPAVDVFRPEYLVLWKLKDTIYLPFNRDHVVKRGNGGGGGGRGGGRGGGGGYGRGSGSGSGSSGAFGNKRGGR